MLPNHSTRGWTGHLDALIEGWDSFTPVYWYGKYPQKLEFWWVLTTLGHFQPRFFSILGWHWENRTANLMGLASQDGTGSQLAEVRKLNHLKLAKVSWNGDAPKSCILVGRSIRNQPTILGIPHLWKPPFKHSKNVDSNHSTGVVALSQRIQLEGCLSWETRAANIRTNRFHGKLQKGQLYSA